MEPKKRWYRRWDLDMSKETVLRIIKEGNTPDKYDHCLFDGPYTPKDSPLLNGKTLELCAPEKKYTVKVISEKLVAFSEACGAAPEACGNKSCGSAPETCSNKSCGAAPETSAPSENYAHVKTLDGEVFLINFLAPGSDTARQITVIADMKTGYATICDAHIGTENSNRDVAREFVFATIAGIEPCGQPHDYTNELVGKAAVWDYGDGGPEVKHIYNSNLYYTYAMESPKGAWMATNPADFIKVRDNLYIFSFVEERQPGLQMLLLMDFNKMHDVGSCWGIGPRDNFFSACVGSVGRMADPNTIF